MRSRNRRSSWSHVIAGTAVICMGLIPSLAGVTPQAAAAAPPALRGGGSIEEAWLTGAGPGDPITLLQNGSAVANPANPGTADSLGSLIIRNLPPGSEYAWDDTTAGTRPRRSRCWPRRTTRRTESPLYTEQPMHEGLNYLTMRDGIQLAATVRYPYGSTC